MLLDRGSIDMVLVPLGLAIMFSYHLFLLYRILRFPHTTVVGYENHNLRAWVERMLRVNPYFCCRLEAPFYFIFSSVVNQVILFQGIDATYQLFAYMIPLFQFQTFRLVRIEVLQIKRSMNQRQIYLVYMILVFVLSIKDLTTTLQLSLRDLRVRTIY